MSILFFLLLIIPIIGSVFIYTQNRDQGFILPLASFAGGTIFVAIVFGAVSVGVTSDVEILNGKVTGKTRVHGTYEESYDCNCRSQTRTVGSGEDQRTESYTECDTCYRTHYTVKWDCQTTLGEFRIDSEDRLSRSVYETPDPHRYTIIKNGDPVAKRSGYTNYVQAVPESLFAVIDGRVKQQFAHLLAPYPIDVYDFYKINRFVSPGFAFTDAAQWNEDISASLIDLGFAKQVNLIVVIAKTDDPQYIHALREHWEGANKNDVVLVIGSLDGQRIEFVDVISWTKNELFKVELIDRIRDMNIIERKQILTAVQHQITKNFERRRMREFAYLSEEIAPPAWALWTLSVFLIGVYGALALGFNGKLQAAYKQFMRKWKR